MRAPRRLVAPDERGFILVGVVMFVLALTILGLSLFNLSSYEAQFLGSHKDETQAFYYAAGGMERAKYILGAKGKLDAVTLDLPLEHVVYARARWVDNLDSTSAIGTNDWRIGRPIEVRVEAEIPRGAGEAPVRKVLEGRFRPFRPLDIYEHVLVSSTGIWADTTLAGLGSFLTYVTGESWANWDVPWRTQVGDEHPEANYEYHRDGVPDPQTASFITTWAPQAVSVPGTKNTPNFTLHSTSGPFQIFMGPTDPDPDNYYGYSNTHGKTGIPVDIDVQGIVVWMFDRGVQFAGPVRVTGGVDDILVIVANRSSDPYFPTKYTNAPQAGVYIEGGITSPTVPVILVSDGMIAMDDNFLSLTFGTYYISCFGGGVYLNGHGVSTQRLCHHPGYGGTPANLDDRVLDPLYENGLLPNVTGARSGTFKPITGTWREVTEDSPS